MFINTSCGILEGFLDTNPVAASLCVSVTFGYIEFEKWKLFEVPIMMKFHMRIAELMITFGEVFLR